MSDIYATTLDLATQLTAGGSLAPDVAVCVELIASRLGRAGFSYERMDRGKPPGRVANLWAWHGTERPLVCLAGHVGAAHAKASLAAMITAAERFVDAAPDHRGSIALALTSKEQATSPEGTLAIVQQLSWRGEEIDACILGKPTCAQSLGDTIACCSPRGPLVDVLSSVISSVAGITPVISTNSGPSDGSWLATVSREVAEFGFVGTSIGTGDAFVPVADIAPLSMIYEQVIAALLSSA